MAVCCRWLAIVLLAFSAMATQAQASDLLRLMDRLDKIDKQDFQSLLKKANDCIRSRDFSCAEDQLRKSKALAMDSADKQSHASAERALSEEKTAVAQEKIRIAQENERRQEQARRDMEMRDAQAKADVLRVNCERLCPVRSQFNACMDQRLDPNRCDDGDNTPTQSTAQMFADTAAQMRADRARISSIHNNAMSNIQAQQQERQRQEQQLRDQQREQQRVQQQRQENDRRGVQMADARSQENTQRARREQDEARAREQREAARVRQEAADRAQRDRDRERERAEQAAKKRQEAQDEARAATDYLAALTRSTRLMARKCPGGEGKYYIVGKKPNIRPEVVSCVDVHYRAQCTNSASFTDGVGDNFVGLGTDCFMGDTYAIEPTPACKVEEVRVTVRSFAACRK
ncbi:MAG: hypothetical protein Q7K57_02310 [Burkholderiaceae bacterium]|nr:hypothetical protein [Burkholderiaceae bacterium]